MVKYRTADLMLTVVTLSMHVNSCKILIVLNVMWSISGLSSDVLLVFNEKDSMVIANGAASCVGFI